MANAQNRRPYIPTWFIPRSFEECNGMQQGFPVWAWNPYTGKGPSLPPVGSIGFTTGGKNCNSNGTMGQRPNPLSCGQGTNHPSCGKEPNPPSGGQGPNPPSCEQGPMSSSCGQGRISSPCEQGPISPSCGGKNTNINGTMRCENTNTNGTMGQGPNPQPYGGGYPTMASSGYLSDSERGNTNTNEANASGNRKANETARRLTETIDCRSHINEHDIHTFILEHQSKLTDENRKLLQTIYSLLGTQPYFVWQHASIEVFGDQMTVMFTSGGMNNKFVICRCEDDSVISCCKQRSFHLNLRIGAFAVYNGFSRVCKAVLGAVGSAGRAIGA